MEFGKSIARNGLTSQLANTLIFKHLTRVIREAAELAD